MTAANASGLSQSLEVRAVKAVLGEVRHFVEDVAQRAGLDAERISPSMPRETRQKLGLGLPLMVALMDEVRFAKAPQGGTIVSLSVII